MERGILFSKAENNLCEYERSFHFTETLRNKYWDEKELLLHLQREVTQEEVQHYDKIMDKVISIQFP